MATPCPRAPRWVTVHDAARAVGRSSRTVRRWLARGAISTYEVLGDRRTYVDLDEIQALMAPKLVRARREEGDVR